MASGDEMTFCTTSLVMVPNGKLFALPLGAPAQMSRHLGLGGDGEILFHTRGWYEVLLRVDWDPSKSAGSRFSHTKIEGEEPLHSEAISATVLARLSEGRQLLRGNTVFGPDHTRSLVLEVWQDSGEPIAVGYAELVVRDLEVPLASR